MPHTAIVRARATAHVLGVGARRARVLTQAPAATVGPVFVALLLAAASACGDPVPELAGGALGFEVPWPQDPPHQWDFLWVIDNSGSMCHEQAMVRENARSVALRLADVGGDHQFAVTTTDMDRPGAATLVNRPNPVPGSGPELDPDCHLGRDGAGRPVAGDYTPLRDAIAAAVACMARPQPDAFVWSDAEVECALFGQPADCAIDGAGCGGGRSKCELAHLFPSPDEYRVLPALLRTHDYADGAGGVDAERFANDFACLAMVGTAGSDFEQGLAAAIQAVSPENTGGPVGHTPSGAPLQPNAPNHGLLRHGAGFGLVVVSDEDDCTHTGTLEHEAVCGAEACVQAASCGGLPGPQQLKDELIANLQASKRDPGFGADQLLLSVVHGGAAAADRGEPGSCGVADCEPHRVCSGPGVEAASGARYEAFLRSAPRGIGALALYSERRSSSVLCGGDFIQALEVANSIPEMRSCLTLLPRCESHADCDSLGGVPRCVGPVGESQGRCANSVELRIRPRGPAELRQLVDTGYCFDGEPGPAEVEQGCVVPPRRYEMDVCATGPGLFPRWIEPESAAALPDSVLIRLRTK